MAAKSVTFTYNVGIGFLGLLTLILAVLKIFGKISISWWLIWAPILIPYGLLFGVLMVIGIVIVCTIIFEKPKPPRYRF